MNDRYRVVPSTPGFDVVGPIVTGDIVAGLSFCPIVAWVIEIFWHKERAGDEYDGALAYPVTIEALSQPEPGKAAVIRLPDRRIIFCEHREVADEAEAIAEFNRQRVRDRELRVKCSNSQDTITR